MHHELHRYEEHPAANADAQPQIYLSVKVTDDAGTESVLKGTWLEPEEVAAVKKDSTALDPIAHRLAAQAEIALEAQLAAKPPTPNVLTDPADLAKLPVLFNPIKIAQQKREEEQRIAKEQRDAEDKAKRDADAHLKAQAEKEKGK